MLAALKLLAYSFIQSDISITGENKESVIISGTHTPATSGDITIKDVTLTHTADIISSAAAGTTNIALNNCIFNITTS